MKVIIAGCRNWEASRRRVGEVVEESGFTITEVVSGSATGIDHSGEEWARYEKIPITYFPADWEKHGRAAGPIRNRQMAKYADAAIIFWDGKSRGTLSMIREMRLEAKPYKVFPLGNVRLVDTFKGEKP
jgi:hypothetical protein